MSTAIQPPDRDGGEVEQLQHVQVQQVEEHRCRTEHAERSQPGTALLAFEVTQQKQPATQRQAQEQ